MPEIKLSKFRERSVHVTFDYSYDAGVHTLSNGDPGNPPSEEFEITEVTDDKGNDLNPLLERYDKMFEDQGADIYGEMQTAVFEDSEFQASVEPDDDFDPPEDFDYPEYDEEGNVY